MIWDTRSGPENGLTFATGLPIVDAVTILQAPEAAAVEATVYDFRRPTTLAREHSRVLELAFETFARQWGTQLTAKVRVLSQVECLSVQMQTYDEYAASLPATTAMVGEIRLVRPFQTPCSSPPRPPSPKAAEALIPSVVSTRIGLWPEMSASTVWRAADPRIRTWFVPRAALPPYFSMTAAASL